MLSTASEKTLHIVRWILIVSWLLLILSLFYDPFSAALTDPTHSWSPLSDITTDSAYCIQVQGDCLTLVPYPIATRVFWGMVVPSAIMILLVFGHETWRRICPLYFFSQIPRAVGLKPILNIQQNSWLKRNHFYLQFVLFFIGLTARILFINAARPVLGAFLILTLLAALTVVWLYGGRSWCHYICPFGIVQTVFTGPRGLLGSKAHTSVPGSITQSMCRRVEPASGMTQSTCIGCKSACMDIDSEKSYWEDLVQPGRRLVQYGYLGLVLGYFAYYRLYSGNFNYYFSGAWAHEPDPLHRLFKPGFYLFDSPVPVPKLVAAPLTLGLFVILSVILCKRFEKLYRAWRRRSAIDSEQALHEVFSLIAFVAFNSFFIYGGRPEINRLPIAVQFLFQAVTVLVSAVWLMRTWSCSPETYRRESLLDKLRRQLKKLPIAANLPDGRSLDQLKLDEVYILAKTLPGATRQQNCQIYQDVLRDVLQAGQVSATQSLQLLEPLRQQLEISEAEHLAMLLKLDSNGETWLYSAATAAEPMMQTRLRTNRSTSQSIQESSNQKTQLRRKL
ncbi:MAG: 4Fe-4S binding protein [Pegethrix bostrychoides GSE-TBD4-15B]|jgi:hypothetical protein|uniref:4Fe-4S binding protein n=1 Tax=Pegethrix bostrychoides GSE-TBD4-15B TaxID=2839662 RepID=A0A951PEU3_9CYAN|nr:4Fe-4S binding protein [Pegethrix bostrychoides GSE-TBD4-15B]